MKKRFTTVFLSILFVVSISSISKTNAQDDCCGLGSVLGSVLYGGIYGGYGFQQFSAEGFNNYIKMYDSNIEEFGFATGFKFGANLFQFMIDDWIIGMKLSYHILKEEHSSAGSVTGGTLKREYELTYKSFHTGLSFAYYISKHLDLKIADLMLTFNSADLETRLSQPFLPAEEREYSSDENPIGFNASTGFTFYVVPPYISIEGTVGYSFFSIERMDGFYTLEYVNDTDFIDGGGLYVFAQLNISVPFN